ncbi:MAG: hypothetical protein ACU0CB_02150, partial [Roseovarius sp.]|uniref:hypothetical protein n=1 Tax=Roseovarius sp. TaxID=1486281 RepID=UPI0040589EFD
LQIKFHGVNLLALPAAARREKVDDFYAARTANTTALPWSNFAPPFSSGFRTGGQHGFNICRGRIFCEAGNCEKNQSEKINTV